MTDVRNVTVWWKRDMACSKQLYYVLKKLLEFLCCLLQGLLLVALRSAKSCRASELRAAMDSSSLAVSANLSSVTVDKLPVLDIYPINGEISAHFHEW